MQQVITTRRNNDLVITSTKKLGTVTNPCFLSSDDALYWNIFKMISARGISKLESNKSLIR